MSKFQNLVHPKLYKLVINTPLQHACNLSKKLNNNIYLKREDLQSVFSFKIRGAFNKILSLHDQGLLLNKNEKFIKGSIKRPIYTCSAGNHAQGVALSAKYLGIRANIIMSKKTSKIKINNVKSLEGNVILHGKNYEEAQEKCFKLAKKNNGIIIHPFDDKHIIAGQGTISKEILKSLKKIDYIFCPIGGGGLIAGISTYIKAIKPSIKIIGVESKNANAMQKSIEEKKIISLKKVDQFTEGTAVKKVGKLTFKLCKENIDEIVIVNKEEICLAIKSLFEENRSMVEPCGAMCLAGIKKYLLNNNKIKNKNLVGIVSGANMDFKKLRYIVDKTNDILN